jgi:hypothetical protein
MILAMIFTDFGGILFSVASSIFHQAADIAHSLH